MFVNEISSNSFTDNLSNNSHLGQQNKVTPEPKPSSSSETDYTRGEDTKPGPTEVWDSPSMGYTSKAGTDESTRQEVGKQEKVGICIIS